MDTYIEFPLKNTAIGVEAAEYESNTVIAEHAHVFQEFVLITKGACMHRFRGIEMPLISGDVFLVPAHQKHGYIMNSQIRFMNCYFFPDELGEDWKRLMRETLPPTSATDSMEDIRSQWENLLVNISDGDAGDKQSLTNDEKSHIQGIIHLTPQEAIRVEALLLQILEEQDCAQFGAEYIKASLLQVILVTIKRAQNRQPPKLLKHNTRKRELVASALSYMEEHYSEELDVVKLARDSALSESYFRMLFKDVTGLTPLEYVTRVRIIKSLEFLQSDGITVRQAAEQVGIYDPNYFTRVFKKVMGYPPSYFKKI
ncbi:AraC family transcriptional regulator [Ruminococcus sp. OA3]|uniref:AraC family transcriptional regulator n=1 Tax=Ruminococcus sp. OA3 TaxID=2914164 RepID=UPI001F0603DF|nr:AraC family transcriptional regulator [Ruminococcus sp. OA3]MCH1982520.1 AraC family transcriptional regulator [Ruminococcus sp. OA3]